MGDGVHPTPEENNSTKDKTRINGKKKSEIFQAKAMLPRKS